MNKTYKTLLLAGSACIALLLTSCGGETVALQDEYVSARNKCQDRAESRVQSQESALSERYEGKERNQKLVEAFNKCMGDKNWDMGKPKDVASTPTNPPLDAKKPTTLENRGVGVGVGPTYALEEKPVKPAAQRYYGTPSSEVGAAMVAPSTVREPRGGIDLRGHEIEQPQGSVPKVQADVLKPQGTRGTARGNSVAPESPEANRRAVAPEDAVARRQGPPPQPRPSVPNTASSPSPDGLDELKRTIEQ